MNNIEQHTTSEEKSWFYEKNGQRIGALAENEMIELIKNETLIYGTAVWKKGFSEWIKIEDTELHIHLGKDIPPPLTGDYVNNSIAWIISFAPIIGFFLQCIFAGMMNPHSEYLREKAIANQNYWYITLILNIALCLWDARRLKKAGINTKGLKGWLWLVPVYLFQRAKALKQNQANFIVWIVSFIVSNFVAQSI